MAAMFFIHRYKRDHDGGIFKIVSFVIAELKNVVVL